jgi:ribonuclease P/MRP protein subunit POP8
MADPGNATTISVASTAAAAPAKSQKSHDLATCTVRAPPFSYAHLEVLNSSQAGSASASVELDAIQVRSYCTAALKQFLGVAGTAISLDILKVEGPRCWLRVPRDDLGAFSAAITAWQGTYEDGVHSTLRVKACSDWLGSLVGREDEDQLWRG